MRVLAHDENLCVGCYTCEEVCSETWFKETDRARSRIRICDDGSGPLSAIFCVQCGECVSVCPTLALSQDRRGVVRLRKSLCVGCLACVGFCPYSAMFHYDGQPEPFNCVACGNCVKECPAEALETVEERVGG